jgi:hypothetical protein
MEVIMDREGGGFFTKALFCILILGLLGYSGINLGMPWLKYYSFRDRLKEISIYEGTDPREKTMKKIMEEAEDRGVPLKEEDIIIESKERRLLIKAEWDHEVQLFGGRIKRVWHFSVDTGK